MSIHRFIGSELFALVVLAGFGLSMAILSHDVRAYPDPTEDAAFIVPMAEAQDYASPRVREVYHAAVKLPIAERPTFIARVLADPSLSDAQRIREAVWLEIMPVLR